MTAKVSVDSWQLLPDALPLNVEPDTLYVVPTRDPDTDTDGALPRYVDTVRYLPKEARAQGAPVEFALPEGSRKFVQEFSADGATWALALLCLNMANDWLIFATTLFVSGRSKAEGWTEEEARNLPLKVSVFEAESGRTYEIEGSGSDVIAALSVIHTDAKVGKTKRKKRDRD